MLLVQQWIVYVLLGNENLRTLHIRMKQHSHNAKYLVERFEKMD
jgi:cystathionine beta-lyase/cystathionine gamma-synthase